LLKAFLPDLSAPHKAQTLFARRRRRPGLEAVAGAFFD